jgi:hypothetical protein
MQMVYTTPHFFKLFLCHVAAKVQNARQVLGIAKSV